MLKKTITYTDYDGVERKEDFYFNLSKAELTEMQLEMPGGFDNYLKQIVAAKDVSSLFKVFKEIILRSYGVKSADGKRFIKSKELSEEFVQTEAYSVLVMELVGSDTVAADFIKAIVPADLSKEVSKELPDKN